MIELPPAWQQSVGRYQIISPLGQGGMADVHLARMCGPAGFDKLVVIKQVRQQLADDPEVMSLFLDEGRIAARLAHPNVVQTYEVGRDGERYFLAMEFLDGQPLSRVRNQLVLPLAMHLRVLVEVLAGLHYAHDLLDYDGTPLGVVHRDVAPQNVFVTYEGAVKVVDFGIAKAKCSMVETRAGFFRGRVTYMAGEQARGERVDRRADIFAVGVMLWEAVTGRRPWAGLEAPTILNRLRAGRFPSVRAACPDVPEDLAAILDKALARAREARYETAAAFQADLEAHLERCGDHTHLRDLGQLIQQQFADNRDHLRALVKQHAGGADAGEKGPRVGVRTLAEERTRPRMEARPSVEESTRAEARLHLEERSTIPEPAVTRARTDPSFVSHTPGSFPAIEGPLVERPRARRRPVSRGLLAMAFAVLMAGVVHGLPARSSHESATAASALPQGEVSPSAATLVLDAGPDGPAVTPVSTPAGLMLAGGRSHGDVQP